MEYLTPPRMQPKAQKLDVERKRAAKDGGDHDDSIETYETKTYM